ncbi:MAG: nucleotide exchange factor GrpE [Phycisphaerales bacterium]|nr:nucleotide exchange factor GrpE [Phycisphaerales bacterium]
MDPHEHDIPETDAPTPDEGAELAQRLAELEAELEDAKNRALRTMADFQNFQRRSTQNEIVARAQGVQAVASSVAGVIDHFDIALNQDLSKGGVEQLIAGMRAIREELLKALGQHRVAPIMPRPGDVFQPGQHEAVMQQAAEGIEPGQVVATLQAGYQISDTLGTRVIRPAKVSVAP